MKGIVRTFAFVVKEIREVVRQPSLMLVLILGPFLILFLFGIGHSGAQPPMPTVLVVPPDVRLPVPPSQYQELLGPGMRLVGATDDRAAAIARLERSEVKIVLAIPPDLYERLAEGEQAEIEIVYNEIDPVTTNYIRFISSAQIAEMNRQILESELQQAAGTQGPLSSLTATAREETAGVERDVAAGDLGSAGQRLARLDATAALLETRLEAVGRYLGPEGADEEGTAAQRVRATRDSLARFRASIAALSRDLVANPSGVPDGLARLRADTAAIDEAIAGLSEVPARVIAAPLKSSVENVAPIEPDFVAYYAPAVLALLLQHIAVTFGALSIVRERLAGATELFRVAPITALQILLGKYIAYLIFGATITVALTVLVVRQLNVPFSGSYQSFAAVVAALILASLGIGFFISLISSSERQAVQLSMLILIASVFFSGFFLSLESFRWPVRGIAYLLPVTYGIRTLQDVMLRGREDDYLAVGALSTIFLTLFVVGVMLLRQELARGHGGRAGAD